MIRICKYCQSPFRPHQKVPHQKYCSSETCQKARRRRWQRQKRLNDDDYRENQYQAQQTWIKKTPDYWKNYRKKNPEYVERNKRLQKKRYAKSKIVLHDSRSLNPVIVKMDDLNQKSNINPGYYMLYPVDVDNIAKMDPLLVRIDVISVT
jgi:hypothetical protein